MSARRVLIVRTGAMGDVLHGLPAVAALRQMWPDAVMDWVVDPRWAPLLVNQVGQGPVVSGVCFAETKAWSNAPFSAATLRSVSGLRRQLRAGRYDLVVDLQGTLRSAVIGRLASGQRLVGFADPREGAARWFYGRAVARQGTHVVEQNAALLGEAVEAGLEPVSPALPVRPEVVRWAEEVVADAGSGPVALLAPRAGWGAKQWPAERFGALARELGDAGWRVLVNAASGADPVCEAVVRASAGAARLVCCGLAELIELTRRVDAVVGGDSGPVHLAAALGRPVVALFGPTDPARNGPWGPGPKRVLRDAASVTSHKRVEAVDPGLARISVEDVCEAVLSVRADA